MWQNVHMGVSTQCSVNIRLYIKCTEKATFVLYLPFHDYQLLKEWVKSCRKLADKSQNIPNNSITHTSFACVK